MWRFHRVEPAFVLGVKGMRPRGDNLWTTDNRMVGSTQLSAARGILPHRVRTACQMLDLIVARVVD
jgi:hypothetical protein